MALTRDAINGDIARELRAAGNEGARYSISRLRHYLSTLGHAPSDIDAALEAWFGTYLTQLTDDDFAVSGDAGWAAIDELLDR